MPYSGLEWNVEQGYKWMIDQVGTLNVEPAGVLGGKVHGPADGGFWPWYERREDIRALNFVGSVTARTCMRMFQGCTNLRVANLTNLVLDSCESLSYMFADCVSLVSVEPSLSMFSLSKVTDASCMFLRCTSLEFVMFPKAGMGDNRSMRKMFYGCGSLVRCRMDRDASGISQLQDMRDAFAYCPALKELTLSNFDTTNVTDMRGLFQGCRSLKRLDLTSFGLAQVRSVRRMFSLCDSLSSIVVTKGRFVVPEGCDKSDMLEGCKRLADGKTAPFTFVEMRKSNFGLRFEPVEPQSCPLIYRELTAQVSNKARGGFGRYVWMTDADSNVVAGIKIFDKNVKEKVAAKEYGFLGKLDGACGYVPRPICRGHWKEGDGSTVQAIIMEHIDGDTLESVVKDLHGPGGSDKDVASEALSLTESIAKALSACHMASPETIVHRDLQPKNIMIRRADHGIVIIDYGQGVISEDPNVTHIRVATFEYSAPEIWESRYTPSKDSQRNKPAVDIWSFGAIVYFIRTGKTPNASEKFPNFEEMKKTYENDPKGYDAALEKSFQDIRKVKGANLELPKLESRLDSALNVIIKCCTEFDPANRPPTMSNVNDAVQLVNDLHKKGKIEGKNPGELKVLIEEKLYAEPVTSVTGPTLPGVSRYTPGLRP